MNTQAKNIESLHDLIVQYGDASHMVGLCASCPGEPVDVRKCADLYAKIKIMLTTVAQPHPATPNKTLDNPPQQDQRVLYWFEPFQKWYLGHYVDGYFCNYSGICDHYDAPYWLPLPPSPKQ